MRKLVKLSALSLVFLGFLWVALFSASIYTYSTLTDESLVAEIEFDRLGTQEYLAYVRTGDFCFERTFRVLGDQWRIDAEFLKWKYWALALGLDSQYRLDRFEGRYRATAEQNARPTLAHALTDETAVDITGVSETLGPLNFLTDTSYGASTYHDIDVDRIYRVYRTTTGLIARSEDRPRPRASGAGLVVEITRACGNEPGLWRRFSVWLNEAIMT